MKRAIAFLLSCLLPSCILHLCCTAQSFDQLDMRFFNEQQGLSNNDTRCFYQDAKGFLWIGTTDGLNRYDGNSIKVFHQKHGDKNSLPGNNFISITGDDSTGLWVFTWEGIAHFFPDDEKAIDYSVALCDGKKINITGTIGKLFYDANHTLCLINDYGISFFDKQQNVFVLHKIFSPLDSIHFTRITDYFQEDKNTLLLLGYYGVIRYNTSTHQYHYVKATLDYFKSQPVFPLNSFIKTDDGKYWITTTTHGLITIDEKTNNVQSFLIDYSGVNPHLSNTLFFIEKPARGIFKNDIVIGNAGYGLYVVKQDEQKNFPGFNKIDNSSNLADKEKVKNLYTNYCFYTDRNEITYIGNDRGVFSVNPIHQVFKKNKSQSEGTVSCILKKRTPANEIRYYFSFSYTAGFCIFDEHLNKLKSNLHVPPYPDKQKISSISSLYLDHKNQLWVCTNNGLYLYDEAQDKFKSFLHNDKNPNSIKYDGVTSMIQDHGGIYWIGTYAHGFQCYNAEKNIFYNPELTTPCNDNAYVFNIIEDAENNIWLGLDRGLVKINSDRNKYVEYFASKDDTTGLSNDAIECFLLDKQKRLWAGTKNGLNLYLPKTNTFKRYFRENGFYSDHVYSLAQDNNGNIWIGTDYALNILNPATGRINFYKGISATTFFCDTGGKVIIGSGGEMNFMTCNENSIKQDSIWPLPYITNLKVSGEDKSFRNVTSLNLNDVKLNYSENYLTFDFTGISYNDAYLNQFKCKLQGLETKWNETGKVRSVSYAALAPGEYDFKLMCCNGDGIWNPKIASLHISIRPPWWQTWWFRLFLILLFASAAYYVYLRRIKAVRAEENIKTKLAQLETQALMAQMNPHFIFNALNSIQACIVSNNNDAAYKYLNKFSILVRSILQNSREEFILLSNEIEILKNYLELEQLRFKDLDFRIKLSSDISANNFKVPSSFMQPFVENAIIHGLAHKTGEKLLEIEILKTGDDLVFKIKDNGIGRKKSAELNLKRTRSHTSLGMTIVESRLKLINEQYKINAALKINDLVDADENATGTEVILILPLSMQEELF